MKTCAVCNKEYEWVSPLYVIEKFNNETERKLSNYCSVNCLYSYATIDPSPDNSKIAYIPMEKVDMCQFCGTYTHPSEFCEADQNTVSQFQTMGNCIGEHSDTDGFIILANLGQNVSLNTTILKYTAQMVKLDTDKEKRNELLYFWDDDVFLSGHINTIRDTEAEPIFHYKEFIVDFEVVPGTGESANFQVFYKTRRIYNPHKLFFPFDIKHENCWFPIFKEKVIRDVNFNHGIYTVLAEDSNEEEFKQYETYEEIQELLV